MSFRVNCSHDVPNSALGLKFPEGTGQGGSRPPRDLGRELSRRGASGGVAAGLNAHSSSRCHRSAFGEWRQQRWLVRAS
jgi:hypothetical protein